jgi:hypothetical protein
MEVCRTTSPELYPAGRVQVRCLLHSSRNENPAAPSPDSSLSGAGRDEGGSHE